MKLIDEGEKICCGRFEKFASDFCRWNGKISNGKKVFFAPEVIFTGTIFRVVYCPFCGAQLTTIEITESKRESLT